MMKQGLRLGRRGRWAVPVAGVAAVGVVMAGAAVAGAQTAPSLPARSAAQLLADVQQATRPGPLTGTLQETANLGLPDLPSSGDSSSGPSSGLSLLSGTHTFNLWIADPAHVRIAEPMPLGETDVRRDGRQVWLWDSTNQTATHIVLPPRPSGHPAARHPSGLRHGWSGQPPLGAGGTPPTPQQAARQILAAVGPTTIVSVQRNVTVAGQPAYQLALAPKDARSLIGEVRIAIDANRYLPLQVQVLARGATTPAFEVGFTALSFGRPAASNFTFTPPSGAKVKTIMVPARPGPGQFGGQGKVGSPGGPGAHGATRPPGNSDYQLSNRPLPRASLDSGSNGYGVSGPVEYGPTASGTSGNSTTGSGPTASRDWTARYSPAGLAGYVPVDAPAGSAGSLGRPMVLGTGWLSVLVYGEGSTPGSNTAAVTAPKPIKIPGRKIPSTISVANGSTDATVATIDPATGQPATGQWNSERAWAGQWSIGRSWSTQSSSAQSSAQSETAVQLSMEPPSSASGSALLRALMRAAKPVHGAWGSGHLLRTSLISVLITSQGKVLLGAVAPSVLYGDAATLK
jgi:hypothetical protein